jgi:hypothetical protein
MQTFDAARIGDGKQTWVVVRVPDFVTESPMKWATVIARAKHDFGLEVVILGRDNGRTLGDPACAARTAQMSVAAFPWTSWNMLEEDD